jgi:hypothetical protein
MSIAEESATKETPAKTAKKNWWWEFVNSQFGLWLLGSVVLSGITWYWNHRNDERSMREKAAQEQLADRQKAAQEQLVDRQKAAQQDLDDRRKDSEFLVSMLPYLSSKDGDVRLRAASVVSARYPENQVPQEVQRVVAQALGGVRTSEQNEGTYNKVVMRLDNPNASTTQLDPAVASSAQDLPKRVYIQIYNEDQREPARKIQELLREQKFVVPGGDGGINAGAILQQPRSGRGRPGDQGGKAKRFPGCKAATDHEGTKESRCARGMAQALAISRWLHH